MYTNSLILCCLYFNRWMKPLCLCILRMTRKIVKRSTFFVPFRIWDHSEGSAAGFPPFIQSIFFVDLMYHWMVDFFHKISETATKDFSVFFNVQSTCRFCSFIQCQLLFSLCPYTTGWMNFGVKKLNKFGASTIL